MPADLSFALGLPPEKAIEYFKSKGYAFSFRWEDVWQEAHAKAFTVAKVMQRDVLEDIRGMVQKSLDEGLTLAQFKKELIPRLQAKGWWGRQEVPDPVTGELKMAQLGSPRRLDTIYRVNMNTAYMAGRYQEMMENVTDRPYWQYVAVLDQRTRPSHAAVHGRVFPFDDPFWDSHFPPNGWNCRCRVRALSSRDMANRNLSAESAEGFLFTEERALPRTGEVKEVTVFRDPKTGRPFAPDLGWSYNPGKAWQAPFTPSPAESALPGGYRNIGIPPPGRVPIDQLPAKRITSGLMLPPHKVSGWSEETYVRAFLTEFGADIGSPAVFQDVIGDAMVISEDLFRDRATGALKVIKAEREQYLKILADTIKDPVEVYLTWVKSEEYIRLCKRYIGIYEGDTESFGGFAVFDLVDDVWQGTTIFKPRSADYLDRQRVGTLVYGKKVEAGS